MVSFQSPFFQLNQRNSILESDSNSKKRKWDRDPIADDLLPYKQLICPKLLSTTTPSFSHIELHLETPLPSEWQRCLDIQSGEIYFYNTRTQKRSVRDPREGPEPTSPRDYHMSLDLELNLPCGSLKHNRSEETKSMMNKKKVTSPPRFPAAHQKKSSFDDSNDDQAVEMVAAACMRCHMLVVLQKSSPTCPNCKFVHPPHQSSPGLFKPPKLSLSC